MSEWREKLLVDRNGKINPRVTANIVVMLRDHPDMVGVFGKNGERRMLLRQPPWDRSGAAWAPRELLHTDHLEAKMWLETRGLTPYTNQVISAVRHLCENNC